ncbi:MAG: 16S rRNA (cytidine(1402)-2'-O)-methyltransferase [Sphaerochaetaceae bacterium]|nr:16S rRNA (cytidine(1402)-2'-O)-methyltransferase [Sphaerochaetaceae bacterium]
MSTLYIVATPIGNLQDITYRAVKTLSEVDIIACEDTRVTQRLLAHYDIHKRLIATHAHNEKASAKGIIELLKEGSTIAFVSDAGTPGVSDPGSLLVEQVRAAGFSVVPIPGVSAAITSVSVAGISGKSFTFEGFLPVKSGKRDARLRELLDRSEAFILYESPYRLLKVLTALAALEPERKVMVAREITKIHEEFVAAKAVRVLEEFSSRQSIKGECVLLVYPEGIE